MGLAAAAERLTICSYPLGLEVGFEERIRVAAAAVFTGIGCERRTTSRHGSRALDDKAMQDILDRRGIAVREVEYRTEWGTAETPDEGSSARNRRSSTCHGPSASGT